MEHGARSFPVLHAVLAGNVVVPKEFLPDPSNAGKYIAWMQKDIRHLRVFDATDHAWIYFQDANGVVDWPPVSLSRLRNVMVWIEAQTPTLIQTERGAVPFQVLGLPAAWAGWLRYRDPEPDDANYSFPPGTKTVVDILFIVQDVLDRPATMPVARAAIPIDQAVTLRSLADGALKAVGVMLHCDDQDCERWQAQLPHMLYPVLQRFAEAVRTPPTFQTIVSQDGPKFLVRRDRDDLGQSLAPSSGGVLVTSSLTELSTLGGRVLVPVTAPLTERGTLAACTRCGTHFGVGDLYCGECGEVRSPSTGVS